MNGSAPTCIIVTWTPPPGDLTVIKANRPARPGWGDNKSNASLTWLMVVAVSERTTNKSRDEQSLKAGSTCRMPHTVKVL